MPGSPPLTHPRLLSPPPPAPSPTSTEPRRPPLSHRLSGPKDPRGLQQPDSAGHPEPATHQLPDAGCRPRACGGRRGGEGVPRRPHWPRDLDVGSRAHTGLTGPPCAQAGQVVAGRPPVRPTEGTVASLGTLGRQPSPVPRPRAEPEREERAGVCGWGRDKGVSARVRKGGSSDGASSGPRSKSLNATPAPRSTRRSASAAVFARTGCWMTAVAAASWKSSVPVCTTMTCTPPGTRSRWTATPGEWPADPGPRRSGGGGRGVGGVWVWFVSGFGAVRTAPGPPGSL